MVRVACLMVRAPRLMVRVACLISQRAMMRHPTARLAMMRYVLVRLAMLWRATM